MAILLVVLVGCGPALAAPKPDAMLDAGFAEMYELDFSNARTSFDSYMQEHPEDPMGEAAMAASYLFEELNKQGVLSSSFFLSDKKLLGGVPNPQHDAEQADFLRMDDKARRMAEDILKASPRNPNALLALTLANGMQADYDALIVKRDIPCLVLLRQTQQSARLLLSVNPNASDAYLALGAANYIIGCLPAYKRFFLGIAGIQGNRGLGMRQLERASANGHYLKPFAKVFLALAALRERQPQLARSLLSQLHRNFPQNPEFSQELAKLDRNRELPDVSR